MTPLAVEKVQTVLHFLQGNCIFLCAMFQDKLLEVQERPFMRNFLPDLNKGLPSVLRSQSRTVGTLSMLNQVFDFKYLLKNC
jgi:hypothetical protein